MSIAVVVQTMVDADVAGVMFSADPTTGRRDGIVLDASPGLGEAVVSGRVTPEHYLATRRGHLRRWTPGGHEMVIRPTPGGGTAETRGEPRDAPPLTKRQLATLAGAATRTGDANRELEHLAGRGRADDGLRQLFDGVPPAELPARLGSDPRYADFDRAFRDFLAGYGHRESASVALSSSAT